MLPYQNLSCEDIPGEIWKDIPGWEGLYQASNFGRVKSLARESSNGKTLKSRILRQTFGSKGYLRVRLYKGQGPTPYQVARLIALTFLPNSENKPTADHINAVKTDNSISNLMWATHHENQMNPILRELRHQIASIRFPQKQKAPDKRFRPVVAINPLTNEVRRYETIKNATLDGFKRRHICRVCKKGRKTTSGWMFFYANDPGLKSYLANLSECQEQ